MLLSVSENWKSVLHEKAQRINTALDQALDIAKENPNLREALRHIPMAGGKRLRPALAMWFAEAIHEDLEEGFRAAERAIPFGTGVELIHNFTLLHDDLMDRDDLRRGVETVHQKFGDTMAINAGDILFARAIEVMTDTKAPPDIIRTLVLNTGRAVRHVGEGQEWDMEFEGSSEVTEDVYLRMIEYKTAMLFRLATEGGALVGGGNPEQVHAAAEYGNFVGLAFQVWDDYLDATASESHLGKPVGSDIRNGKCTLLIVHALTEGLDEEGRKKLQSVLGNSSAGREEIQAVIDLVREGGTLDYAKEKAESYVLQAEVMLDSFPPTPTREILREVAHYIVQRSY